MTVGDLIDTDFLVSGLAELISILSGERGEPGKRPGDRGDYSNSACELVSSPSFPETFSSVLLSVKLSGREAKSMTLRGLSPDFPIYGEFRLLVLIGCIKSLYDYIGVFKETSGLISGSKDFSDEFLEEFYYGSWSFIYETSFSEGIVFILLPLLL